MNYRIKNRKAQGSGVAMWMAALALVMIMGFGMYYHFIVLRGQATKQSSNDFTVREYAVTTTNHLNNLLSIRDVFGETYSVLIERAIDSPESKYENGKTYSEYLRSDINPKICDFFEKGIGKNNHQYRVLIDNDEKFKCGPAPQAEQLFIEKQFLPTKDGKKIKVSLSTWAS